MAEDGKVPVECGGSVQKVSYGGEAFRRLFMVKRRSEGYLWWRGVQKVSYDGTRCTSTHFFIRFI